MAYALDFLARRARQEGRAGQARLFGNRIDRVEQTGVEGNVRFDRPAALDNKRNREARVELTRELVALDQRLEQQKAELERTEYGRIASRVDTGWNLVFDIEQEIDGHTSVLALAANWLIAIELDDENDGVLRTYRASLAASRPQIAGPIADAADRVLAEAVAALSDGEEA